NPAVYTFSPTAGQCATTQTFTVNINPNITPAFSFGTSLTICTGGIVPALPDTSTNGILGTWSPNVVDNQNSGLYTFTPIAGQCATSTIFAVTVTSTIPPVFSFGNALTICEGGTVPALPDTSTDGITGTWSPNVIDNQNTFTYIFTPEPGQCAAADTFTVTVMPSMIAVFSFDTTISICTGGVVPILPDTSTNGITGLWSPTVTDNQNSGVYIFTPTPGQCAAPVTLTITVNPILTPTFSFGTSIAICSGSIVPLLPDTSMNGVIGTWSPAVVDNQNSGLYTFTPSPGQCAIGTDFTVAVTATTNPVFSIGTTLSICTGGIVPILPDTSTNGIDGIWNPSVVSNQTSGVYTFIPNATPQQCILSPTYTVAVNAIVTPAFSFGDSISICIGANVPTLTDTSTNGITGTWSPAVVDNQNSATYTFTPDTLQCATTAKFKVDINQIPTVVVRADTTLNDGDPMPTTFFTGTPPAAIFNWVNSNPSIGLPGSGTGNIPSFLVVNRGDDPVVSIITVTPQLGGCLGTPHNFNITVDPLNKDVFVPNVFTPNGDGKNDKLYAYGNYIDKLEMKIFNQWGQQIAVINSLSQGWDGTQHGKPQPVGVYVYVLKAVMTDGRIINKKGSITLLR
ncbi:MAG: gliding motility-associated C-terminal domain-containing protein, partial [Chitinophagales bacterium]